MNGISEGILAGITMLGGLCAFIYWVFCLLEKRLEQKIDFFTGNFDRKIEQVKQQSDYNFNHLEQKIDNLSSRLEEVIHEQKDQRNRTDQLYQILINLVSDQKSPRTNP